MTGKSKLTPKYKYFHKREIGVKNQEEFEAYMSFVSKRHNVTTNDAFIFAAKLFRLPLNAIRDISTKYYYTGENVPDKSSVGFTRMSMNLIKSVHYMTEQIRLLTLSNDLALDQRIRIVYKWIRKNMISSELNENYSVDMLRLMLVIYSLGFSPHNLMDFTIESLGETDEINDDYKNILDILEIACDYADYVFGTDLAIVEGLVMSVNYLKPHHF